MTINTLADLPEDSIRQMIDYAAGTLTNGKHDFRIPYIVANEWALNGHAVLSTNRLAEQFGSTRRTICAALDRLECAGAIKRVGTAASGAGKYVPALEVGAKWRASREARNGGR